MSKRIVVLDLAGIQRLMNGVLPSALLCTLLAACSEPAKMHHEATFAALRNTAPTAEREWRHYLGGPDSSQFSSLNQINPDNVDQLELAWTYDPGGAGAMDSQIPTNPLVINGVLYGLDARKHLFALNAATGEELWTRPFDNAQGGKGSGRGLVYWEGLSAGGEFSRRLIVGLKHRLWAVDALSGRVIEDFGEGGYIDLRHDLDRAPDTLNVNVTSPGTLYKDLLIQGFATSESPGGAPGFIRAYHVPTGDLRWTFRTIPRPGEPGGDSWGSADRYAIGGANAWAGITVDAQRGIAFIPTGSPSGDFYGPDRPGDNLFANSLLALDANTGERLWHYQVVRHDLWDRDLPSPPNLVSVVRQGKALPAVAQATKTGHLFVFHRETGEPLFPITEVPVTGLALPGEHPAASQPLPEAPPAFTRQTFEVTDITPTATASVQARIEGMSSGPTYIAPNEAGQVIYPGIDGGAEWGGQAWDPGSRLLYVNAQEVPYHFAMVPVRESIDEYSLQNAYLMFCATCHGSDRRGNGDSFPSLRDIGQRYWPWETYRIIRRGQGRMPGFIEYPWYMAAGLAWYLHTVEQDPVLELPEGGTIGSWHFTGYNTLLDDEGLPGSRPPWGSLSAIDLDQGKIAWKVPLGDYPQALELGLTGLGAANYGGPVVTSGGLLFIAATPDRQLRAFNKATGEVLWQHALPAAGFATPAVYEADGRQFVVIAAGGGKLGQPSGSTYQAFALPAQQAEPSAPP